MNLFTNLPLHTLPLCWYVKPHYLYPMGLGIDEKVEALCNLSLVYCIDGILP